jgi:ribosomal protein L32
MTIEECPSCQDRGQIGELCEACGVDNYTEVIEWGICQNCSGQGIRGTLCSDCEDMSVIFD